MNELKRIQTLIPHTSSEKRRTTQIRRGRRKGTIDPNPNSPHQFGKEKKIQIGEREKGNGPTSPCVGMALRWHGRRRAEPG